MPPPRSSSRGWPRTTGKVSRGRRDRSTRGRPGKRSMRSSGSRKGAPRERAREEDFFEREEGVSGSILGEILAAKRRHIAAGEFTAETVSHARSRSSACAVAPPDSQPDGARFTAALSSFPSSLSKQNLLLPPLPLFLSEIKHRSPSAGLILADAPSRIESVARAYRRGGASALSVVIEQDFCGGDPSWLPRAKAASGLPVLMKDFVVNEVQLDFAAALGADAVLLIVAALDEEALARLHAAARTRSLAVLVEAHDDAEIRRALAAGAEIVGVNARDLKTFAVDLPGMARLGALLPASVTRVAESGIRTRADVGALAAAGYGAFLVGETLLRASDPSHMLRELRGENPTEVKICGITREEDVDTCLEQGVDWIGLVFAAGSPRRLTPEKGRFLRMRAKGEAAARAASGAAKGVVGFRGESRRRDARGGRARSPRRRSNAISPLFPSQKSSGPFRLAHHPRWQRRPLHREGAARRRPPLRHVRCRSERRHGQGVRLEPDGRDRSLPSRGARGRAETRERRFRREKGEARHRGRGFGSGSGAGNQGPGENRGVREGGATCLRNCLLYTSDAADE